MNDNNFTIAMILAFMMFIAAIAGGEMYDSTQKQRAIERLIEQGKDPIHARCAIKGC